jgi:hypothetical protein
VEEGAAGRLRARLPFCRGLEGQWGFVDEEDRKGPQDVRREPRAQGSAPAFEGGGRPELCAPHTPALAKAVTHPQRNKSPRALSNVPLRKLDPGPGTGTPREESQRVATWARPAAPAGVRGPWPLGQRPPAPTPQPPPAAVPGEQCGDAGRAHLTLLGLQEAAAGV